ncbi:TetR/AcrR family transcriptional regulator [Mycobacterium spongiae]|uniref:TetR family transcriptional regulator n=1 Tax=Mycobacterium spongiae TaxID=886343 RepID=A0A975JYH3_9MYCO|nr:TetR family transcriptional regulator [Mycobacterium spongiae]QUR68041.1 TetR family transcriptional regulator [Mycobacterium spongiae]
MKTRIRDAAIALFADNGFKGTNMRAIAAKAGVSAASVVHHYGSKDALVVECDRHVAEIIRERKRSGMRSGPGFDPVAALREAREGPPVLRYLAVRLADRSPQVAALVDDMVADAAAYLADGVESGMMRPTNYPYTRAVVLTIWSLGALVLHEHLERLIGVDIVNTPESPTAGSAYVGPVLEILTDGIVDPDVAARMKAAFVDEPTLTTDGKE